MVGKGLLNRKGVGLCNNHIKRCVAFPGKLRVYPCIEGQLTRKAEKEQLAYMIIVQPQARVVVHPHRLVEHIATLLHYSVGCNSQHRGYITRLTGLSTRLTGIFNSRSLVVNS